MRRDTAIQHGGEDPERQQGAAAPAIYRTSLFAFPDCRSLEAYFHGRRERHLYSRDSNPTVRMLEEKIAALEGSEDAMAFSSGMGAISAVLLAHLSAGDHLVLFSRSYSPTLAFARGILERLGVKVTLIDPEGLDRLEEAITARTRMIYVESPASLTFEVLDLEKVAAAAVGRSIVTVTDNSWASPIYQQPARLGIDIAVHSGTKYVSGHSDIVLGLAAGSRDAMRKIRRPASLLGACLSPADASLAIRGLRTLPLRMRRHEESALAIARRLESHPKVRKVLHPALESFPSHASWKRQFSGSSGLFSFLLDGDEYRFCDSLKLFLIGVSWGGYESLVFPARASAPVDPKQTLRPDMPQGLIRLSVGLEDPEDLWEDLERALEKA